MVSIYKFVDTDGYQVFHKCLQTNEERGMKNVISITNCIILPAVYRACKVRSEK